MKRIIELREKTEDEIHQEISNLKNMSFEQEILKLKNLNKRLIIKNKELKSTNDALKHRNRELTDVLHIYCNYIDKLENRNE